MIKNLKRQLDVNDNNDDDDDIFSHLNSDIEKPLSTPLKKVKLTNSREMDTILSTTKSTTNNNNNNNNVGPTTPFKTFTPLKSTFSIASPFKNDSSFSNKKNNNSTLSSSQIKPQIENIFIPESPCNIKLKGNKIRNTKQIKSKQPQNNLMNQFQQSVKDEQETAVVGAGVDETQKEDKDTIFSDFINNEIKSTKSLKPTTLSADFKMQNESDIGKQQMYYPKPESFKVQSNLDIPVDLSLKSTCSFISSESLEWCSKAMNSHSIRSKSYKLFQNPIGTAYAHQTNSYKASDEEMFLRSLYYHVSPSNPLPENLSSTSNENNSFPYLYPQWTDTRWSQYRESLDSLFSNLKENEISYFYLIQPMEFTILFQSSALMNDNEPIALINPTTKKFRELLNLESIEWQTPFLLNTKSTTTTDKSKEELEKERLEKKQDEKVLNIIKKKEIDPAYYQSSPSSSIVIIKNLVNLEKFIQFLKKRLISFHFLYKNQQFSQYQQQRKSLLTPKKQMSSDSLMFNQQNNNNNNNNEQHLSSSQPNPILESEDNEIDISKIISCKDVPILLCKSSFIGSTCQMNKILSNGPFIKQTRSKLTNSSSGSLMETAYKLELDGPILPDSILEIYQLFSKKQTDFNCKLLTNNSTFGFNIVSNNISQQTENNNNNNNNNDTEWNRLQKENLFRQLPPPMSSLEKISKSSQILDRNIIQHLNYINNQFEVVPIG